MEATLAILSVHYRYPALLQDQMERLRACAAPAREALGLELRFHPVVHSKSDPDVAAEALDSGGIDLRGRPDLKPSHGESLAEAFLQLRAEGLLQDGDLLAVMDHDTHPLDPGLFAATASALLAREDLAGIGIPQWHRGHCYLHPSFLLTRVATVERMTPDRAFLSRMWPDGRLRWDTAEGFTAWCEENGLPTCPLRVESTGFPWPRWDSEMVPDGGPRLTGEHGEPVHVGHLMRYGLEAGRPLLSHVWTAPLLSRHVSKADAQEVLAAYLAEPMAGGMG
ncbi:MAG TPA: hypothetical protein VN493_21355 [Thermoanaerobaculia bacterium]|nr:hypothetical protein [Thermoanaerobaculia bacterium]